MGGWYSNAILTARTMRAASRWASFRSNRNTLHDLRSASKSIVGLLYGIALAAGKVPSPDQPLMQSFPEYADLFTDAGRRRWTLHHVLAGQTAKATEEISAQIAQMQTATQHSVAAIKEIGSTITHISEISSAIAAAVEEQGAATQEVARNVQQAAQGATQVAGSIAEVNRGAADTGAAAEQVHGSARELLSESDHLKSEVEKFLTSVRAA
jgi:ABC-type transporter Mla subunit MlaD